jgi:hypothetical protein
MGNPAGYGLDKCPRPVKGALMQRKKCRCFGSDQSKGLGTAAPRPARPPRYVRPEARSLDIAIAGAGVKPAAADDGPASHANDVRASQVRGTVRGDGTRGAEG